MKKEFVQYILGQEEDLVLATILRTIGSTPRKAGTTMVVHADGRTFGTIGGGRAEADIKTKAVKLFSSHNKNERFTVSLDDHEAVKEGMVCGGSIEVWIEQI